MDFLEGLNPPQREAVKHVAGPLLILAGAGSGKTRVITHRIAHLIRQHRVPPPAILAVTFTNKAADEMRDRVLALLGETEAGSRPRVSTFHSFCVRVLRRDGDPLASLRPGFKRSFGIYDEDDQLALVKAAYRHVGLDENFMKYRTALSSISHAKTRNETPADLYRKTADPRMSRLAAVWEEYEKALRNANALDFDDLLIETVRLLQHDEATRAAWNHRLSFLMIDEYQDTNRNQYELMRLLTEEHSNVCVVGDEDQSIYSWRGADIRNILDFERDYPETRTIRLEQNYRSTRNILDGAGAVVAHNVERKGKTLWTEAPPGERIGVYCGYDGENEALFIADSLDKLLRSSPSDRVAVLYRTNAQSRQIEEALRRYGRKYLVVGGFSFYQRAEVKDALAYLKLALEPQDSISLLRIINTPARGIGKTTVAEIERYALDNGLSMWTAIGRLIEDPKLGTRAQAALAAFHKLAEEVTEAVASRPLHEALAFLLERTGYLKMLEAEATPEAEGRAENLKELVNAAAEAVERGEGVIEFLDHAALVSESDDLDERAQISLLTLHNAKGLEFPIVFLAGMEEGLFPHIRSIDSPPLLEEERRLCYVGMTRAQKRLYLSWARHRRRYGGGEQDRTIPSRFLKEVPRRLVAKLGSEKDDDRVDLTAERWEVRKTARRAVYTGKTYNSVENIAQFFAERGLPAPKSLTRSKPAAPAKPAGARKAGSTVVHPKYGRGTVLRREGEGENAKLTISFPGYGLKKLVEKYAGFKE